MYFIRTPSYYHYSRISDTCTNMYMYMYVYVHVYVYTHVQWVISRIQTSPLYRRITNCKYADRVCIHTCTYMYSSGLKNDHSMKNHMPYIWYARGRSQRVTLGTKVAIIWHKVKSIVYKTKWSSQDYNTFLPRPPKIELVKQWFICSRSLKIKLAKQRLW